MFLAQQTFVECEKHKPHMLDSPLIEKINFFVTKSKWGSVYLSLAGAIVCCA